MELVAQEGNEVEVVMTKEEFTVLTATLGRSSVNDSVRALKDIQRDNKSLVEGTAHLYDKDNNAHYLLFDKMMLILERL